MVNSEGYRDNTADTAVKNADKERKNRLKSRSIIQRLQTVALWNGCKIEGSLTLILEDGTRITTDHVERIFKNG